MSGSARSNQYSEPVAQGAPMGHNPLVYLTIYFTFADIDTLAIAALGLTILTIVVVWMFDRKQTKPGELREINAWGIHIRNDRRRDDRQDE
jgi:hypothetical protein